MRRSVARGLAVLLVSLALDACASPSHEAPQPRADVYLLAGQSNMQGVGTVDELPESWRAPCDDVWFWNGMSFEVLDPARTKLGGRVGEFGPELGFAHELRTLGVRGPIHIVKFHRSGQGLHAGWDGNRWVGPESGPERATFHPGDSADDPHVGRHYQAWLAQVRAALASLAEDGLTPRIHGVVWMQGEQDSKAADSAASYAANLRRLRERLGADLGAPDLPWVYGQVLPHEPALPRFTHRTELRASMAALDARSGSRDATPGMWMVPTEDMPLRNDTVHYDTEGQRRLGAAFATAFVALEAMTGARADGPYRACGGSSRGTNRP